MSSNLKGYALERAVQAIEQVILQSSPGLGQGRFKINARKRITVEDVHHEIDLFVTVEPAKGYESVFIFECKNWEEKVGKNDIIIFADKIDATGAQRGYFVAKSFTKDAVARAQQDARLTLLTATEHDPASSITLDGFHITVPVPRPRAFLTFHTAPIEGANGEKVVIPNEAIMYLQGIEIPLADYLDAWLKELYDQRLLRFNTIQLEEGVHRMLAEDERSFGVGECVVEGLVMVRLSVEADFGVQVLRPPVISDFEVSSRGRVIRFATALVQDHKLDAAFVFTNPIEKNT